MSATDRLTCRKCHKRRVCVIDGGTGEPYCRVCWGAIKDRRDCEDRLIGGFAREAGISFAEAAEQLGFPDEE